MTNESGSIGISVGLTMSNVALIGMAVRQFILKKQKQIAQRLQSVHHRASLSQFRRMSMTMAGRKSASVEAPEIELQPVSVPKQQSVEFSNRMFSPRGVDSKVEFLNPLAASLTSGDVVDTLVAESPENMEELPVQRMETEEESPEVEVRLSDIYGT